jgi:hypothetical protein
VENDRSALRCGGEQRLAFIEIRLFWEGHVNRSDVVTQFGLSVNQASSDLSRYFRLAPHNIDCDRSLRTDVRQPASGPSSTSSMPVDTSPKCVWSPTASSTRAIVGSLDCQITIQSRPLHPGSILLRFGPWSTRCEHLRRSK